MNKVDLYNRATEIMPYALEFYGDKYRKTVLETYRHADIDFLVDETKKGREGTYSYEDYLDGNYHHIIRVKNNPELLDTVLTHELFGHAVLSNNKPFIKKDGILYRRNGLCLVRYDDPKEKINLMLNEGIVEYIANEIKRYYTKINYPRNYIDSINIAIILFGIYGKDKMLDILINNKGDFRDLDFFDDMSRELDKDNPDMSEYVLKLVRRN